MIDIKGLCTCRNGHYHTLLYTSYGDPPRGVSGVLYTCPCPPSVSLQTLFCPIILLPIGSSFVDCLRDSLLTCMFRRPIMVFLLEVSLMIGVGRPRSWVWLEDAVVRLRSEGHTIRRISSMLGIPRATVHRMLRRCSGA